LLVGGHYQQHYISYVQVADTATRAQYKLYLNHSGTPPHAGLKVLVNNIYLGVGLGVVVQFRDLQDLTDLTCVGIYNGQSTPSIPETSAYPKNCFYSVRSGMSAVRTWLCSCTFVITTYTNFHRSRISEYFPTEYKKFSSYMASH
jgi:hypothetical protein